MKAKGDSCNFTYKLLIILFAVVIVGFSMVPICNYFRSHTHDHTKDYGKLYRTGQIALHNGDIYRKSNDETFQFMYPPTAAVFLAALSAHGLLPFIVILVLANSASWVGSVFLGVYLTTGKILRQHPFLYLAPTLCCTPYVWNIYLLGQPNLLLLVCMLGAFTCLQLKKEWCAGALIALAVAIKAFPILSIVYLVYRRHWKATLSTLAFLLFFLVLLPAPFRGFHRNLLDIKTWIDGMVLRYEADSIAQRPDRGYSYKNQSLIAVANRLLRPVDAFQLKKESVCVNFTDLEFKSVNVIIVIAGLGLCLFYITSMPRYAHRTFHTDSIEYAMLLLLILIITPLSFTYFYVWLLYPFMVVFNILLAAPNPSRERNITLTWLAVCLLLLSFMLPIPRFDYIEAMGNTFWACVLLLVGFGGKLRQLRTIHARLEVGRET
ncbi:MAG: glycosyltransferase family 87 protein [Candidatus Brocadia sp.]